MQKTRQREGDSHAGSVLPQPAARPLLLATAGIIVATFLLPFTPFASWQWIRWFSFVQGGIYLERCLVYVDLNRVRCGMVSDQRLVLDTGIQSI